MYDQICGEIYVREEVRWKLENPVDRGASELVFFVQGFYDYDIKSRGRAQSVAHATELTQFAKCVSERTIWKNWR